MGTLRNLMIQNLTAGRAPAPAAALAEPATARSTAASSLQDTSTHILGATRATGRYAPKTPPEILLSTSVGDDKLPRGWKKMASTTHMGKAYYVNTDTGESTWTKPEWEMHMSKSFAGKCYYVNV